jgi:hypothetical protein
MAETINWLYSVRADRGPNAALNGTFQADAYERISVTLAAGATQDVTIAPGTWADVLSLVISADDLSGDVTVEPDGAAAAVPLDAPIVLLGAGAVALLGAGNATVTLENTGAEDVLVDFFVARDATP